jgi:flagellar L-ring protein precursor FlgH
LENTITAQVVQILPNGNFVVQGKKTAINSGETVNIIVSGIVDPRFVNKLGQVSSNKVANFQVAVTGKGSVSRSGQDGPVNRLIRNMF